MIGKTLGHFHILEKIGQGGMGEVFLAEDTSLHRMVAMKFLPVEMQQDDTARKRLIREARSAAALDHPYICHINEVGESEGRAFIAMEYVKGRSLKERLAAGALPLNEVLRAAIEVAEALEAAHAKGIIHQDIKPGNIMLTPTGHAKVMDFGLAKQATGGGGADSQDETVTALTRCGAAVGTLAYMPPEQLRGQMVDSRSDLWALGVTLYEMATGMRPFQGQDGFELMSSILNRVPRPLPSQAPAELGAVIGRCLEKDPEKRYQRAGDLREALIAVQAGTVSPWVGWRYRLTHSRWPVIAAVALALFILAGILVTLDVGGLRTRLTGASDAAKIQSLAVLPLENLSGNPEQDYFAAGMTETLITDLARLGGLRRVTARATAMRYQGTKRPFAEIARELRVDALVTGSVQRFAERVSIAVQLIDPETEDQLWTNRYERDLKDVIRLQNEIVAAIVGEIRIRLTPGDKARLASARPVDPEAYDAYLKGCIETNRLSPKNFEMAMEYFRLALQKDPAFALAHTGIARVWNAKGHLGYVPPRDALPMVRAAVSQALALDERLAEAHRVLGSAQFYLEWNWEGAVRSWQRASELEPNDADSLVGLAAYSCAMGRLDGTAAAFEHALESDPHNPQLRDFYGHQLLRLRRYDEAVVQFRQVLNSEPAFRSSLNGLWRAFHFKRMFDEASGYAAQYFAASGYPEPFALLATA